MVPEQNLYKQKLVEGYTDLDLQMFLQSPLGLYISQFYFNSIAETIVLQKAMDDMLQVLNNQTAKTQKYQDDELLDNEEKAREQKLQVLYRELDEKLNTIRRKYGKESPSIILYGILIRLHLDCKKRYMVSIEKAEKNIKKICQEAESNEQMGQVLIYMNQHAKEKPKAPITIKHIGNACIKNLNTVPYDPGSEACKKAKSHYDRTLKKLKKHHDKTFHDPLAFVNDPKDYADAMHLLHAISKDLKVHKYTVLWLLGQPTGVDGNGPCMLVQLIDIYRELRVEHQALVKYFEDSLADSIEQVLTETHMPQLKKISKKELTRNHALSEKIQDELQETQHEWKELTDRLGTLNIDVQNDAALKDIHDITVQASMDTLRIRQQKDI